MFVNQSVRVNSLESKNIDRLTSTKYIFLTCASETELVEKQYADV